MSGTMAGERVHRRAAASRLGAVDLIAAREACGISRKTVAAALGVTPQGVGQWERGDRRPPESYRRVAEGMLRHLETEEPGAAEAAA